MINEKVVTYEDFGAIGDGTTDDMPAIVKAHEYANKHGLAVVASDDATYYIGGGDLTAIIKTDVFFGKAHFIIDDRELDNVKSYVFKVESDHAIYTPNLSSLSKGQKELKLDRAERTFIKVFNADKRIFRRKGENANTGVDANDCFIVDRDGRIENEIVWDYPVISKVFAKCVEDTPITVEGGIFTTIANRWERVYNYHYRGFHITRSSVTVKNLTHYIEEEGDTGAPYAGFLSVSETCDVTIENCLLTPHKTYMTKDSNPPTYVNRMGTYELNINSTVRTVLRGIRQSRDITDTRFWGLIGSNFSKEILIEDCEMSRFDAHMGVTGATIRRSRIGHQCLQLIGFGDFVIEDSFVFGHSFISLRADYGSIWDGAISVKNCIWKPFGKGELNVIKAWNSADHDFGYECRMPSSITIDGLHILDGEVNPGAKIYVLPDYDPGFSQGKPYPYVTTKRLSVSRLTTELGRTAEALLRPEEYPDIKVEM